MSELGELEAQHQEFARRKIGVFVISMEEQSESRKSQQQFPHFTFVADSGGPMCKAMQVIHPDAAGPGKDAAAPTTIFVDGAGVVRWIFRPERYLNRLRPAELLAAIDGRLPRAASD